MASDAHCQVVSSSSSLWAARRQVDFVLRGSLLAAREHAEGLRSWWDLWVGALSETGLQLTLFAGASVRKWTSRGWQRAWAGLMSDQITELSIGADRNPADFGPRNYVLARLAWGALNP